MCRSSRFGFRIDGLWASISRIVGNQVENVVDNCLGTGVGMGCIGRIQLKSGFGIHSTKVL